MANIGSLFKKTKTDPDFLATQERVRLSLLKTLSRAIKEVQLLFTKSGEGGRVGDCRATQRLCTRFENVLRHGQKAKWFGQSSSFWPVVQQISRKQAIEYISGLQYAQSYSAKCRAWIRMAVNESSLESYIGVICQNNSLRSQYYETHAFLRDEEVVSPLQQLLAGLSQINFNITVDTASLEFEAVPEALQPPLQLRVSHHMLDDKAHRYKKLRHKKLPSTQHGRQVTPIEDSDDSSGDDQWSDQEEEEEEEEEAVVKNKKSREGVVMTGGDSSGQSIGRVVSHSSNERDKRDANEKEGAAVSVTSSQLSSMAGSSSALCSEVYGSLGERGERAPEYGDGVGEEEEDGEGKGEGERWSDESGGKERETVEGRSQEQEDGDVTLVEDISTGEGGGEYSSQLAEEPQQDGEQDAEEEEALIGEEMEGEEEEEGEKEMMEEGDLDAGYEHDNRTQDPELTLHEVALQNTERWSDTAASIDSPPPTPFDTEVPADVSTKPDCGSKNPFDLLEENFDNPNQSVEIVTSYPHRVPDYGSSERGSLNPFDSPEPSRRPIFAIPPPPTLPPPPLATQDHPDAPSPIRYIPHTSPSPLHRTPRSSPLHYPPHSSPSPLHRTPRSSPSPLHHPPHSSPSPLHHPPRSSPSPLHLPSHSQAPGNPPHSTTSSPPMSTTSSDFFREAAPVVYGHRHLLSDDVGRASRSDSLEWSMYVETLVEEPDNAALLSTLQLEEDHYPAEMGIPELREAILRLKKELSSSCSPPSEQHTLRRRIVQLQLKLHYKQEEQEQDRSMPHQEVCGHKFVRQPRQTRVLRGLTCLACRKKVRGLIREWYRCRTCQNVCHKKCVPTVTYQCVIPGDDTTYILEVCPETGLTTQLFRCNKCNRAFNQLSPVEARLCDYEGVYYCPDCHINDTAVIPARVMHNWDFTTRKVCCQCSTLLFHLSSRPLLRVQEVNPLLYTYVPDLAEVESLRRDILQMKEYFLECKAARDSQLLHKLDVFPNFKEHPSLLTLHEMVEIQNGCLLPVLEGVHSSFSQHIMKDCQTCSEHCHSCGLCSSGEPLYPFGHQVALCVHCSAVYHKACFNEVSSCPKCHRTKTAKLHLNY